jgi:hypothetical protein
MIRYFTDHVPTLHACFNQSQENLLSLYLTSKGANIAKAYIDICVQLAYSLK